ncbi:carboxypeptidase-like regulatory domain-containing protein [Lewinella sp. IMCC34183]|uniref:carboxypeptidase-like regulatory domain-containing protein n=1 Tax=Lewinella sp. IMCC34183 TaxID=2248762 RepID=UPI000E258606|nr:carboxypeptidase-like regulatory domain-containing protein [Lewinella sp. IMCC34183]
MAYTPLSLHIAAPCSEDWQEMRPAESGCRFCSSCQKQVTDFSQLTDREIVRLIKDSPDGICGRFRQSQLDRPLREYVPPAPKWKGLLAAGGLFVGAGATFLAHALPPLPGIEVVQSGLSSLGITHARESGVSSGVFRGRILDTEGEAIVGAELIVQGTDYTLHTDQDGRFSFFAESGQRLLIYSFGHQDRWYTIRQGDTGFYGTGVEWRQAPVERPVEMMMTGTVAGYEVPPPPLPGE